MPGVDYHLHFSCLFRRLSGDVEDHWLNVILNVVYNEKAVVNDC